MALTTAEDIERALKVCIAIAEDEDGNTPADRLRAAELVLKAGAE
jgi:hypothetical protein